MISDIQTRLKRASLFIASGLLVQVSTFLVKHPLSFVAFLAVGCPLVLIGVVLFLLSLISHGETVSPEKRRMAAKTSR
jgi:hypothetical protein